MADDFSFDVVSKLNLQEVENAVAQANKEISTRFDFKGSVSRLEWDKKELLTLYSDDEQKLKSVIDVLQSVVAGDSVRREQDRKGNAADRKVEIVDAREPEVPVRLHSGRKRSAKFGAGHRACRKNQPAFAEYRRLRGPIQERSARNGRDRSPG